MKNKSFKFDESEYSREFFDDFWFNFALSSLLADELAKDYKQSYDNFKMLSYKGDPEAQYYLGCMYKNGLGVKRDIKEANKFFKETFDTYLKRANNGNNIALFKLALMYLNGYGVEQSYQEAIKLFKKSADIGNLDAKFLLGDIYKKGLGIPRDNEQADKYYKDVFEVYLKRAENGNRLAQYNLGDMYIYGRGVDKNYKEGVEYLKKSAEQGYLKAKYKLANIYRDGIFADKNKEESDKYFKECFEFYKNEADIGDVFAQYRVGCMYKEGLGVEQNYQEAIKYLKISADNGNEEAEYDLGEIYKDGLLVDKNEAEADKYFKKAFKSFSIMAEKGDSSAKFKLFLMYHDGNGVEKNNEKAVEYWNESRLFEEGAEFIQDFTDSDKLIEIIKNNYKSNPKVYKKIVEHISSDSNNVVDFLSKNQELFKNEKYIEYIGNIANSESMSLELKECIQKISDILFLDKQGIEKIKELFKPIQESIVINYLQKADFLKDFFTYLGDSDIYNINNQLENFKSPQIYKRIFEWLYKLLDNGNSYAHFLFGVIFEEFETDNIMLQKIINFLLQEYYYKSEKQGFFFSLYNLTYYNIKLKLKEVKEDVKEISQKYDYNYTGVSEEFAIWNKIFKKYSKYEIQKVNSIKQWIINYNETFEYLEKIFEVWSIYREFYRYSVCLSNIFKELNPDITDEKIKEYMNVKPDGIEDDLWKCLIKEQDEMTANFEERVGQIFTIFSKVFKDIDTRNFIGELYRLNKDYNKAYHFYKSSEKTINSFSMFKIAEIYRKGLGGKQDFKKAIYFYKKSMKYGNIFAKFVIENLYESDKDKLHLSNDLFCIENLDFINMFFDFFLKDYFGNKFGISFAD